MSEATPTPAPINHTRSFDGSHTCSCGKTGLVTGKQCLGHEAGAKRRGEFVNGWRKVKTADGRTVSEYLENVK